MESAINTNVFDQETIGAIKGRNIITTSWNPKDPGLRMDANFFPKRKDGKPAARARKHQVHVWKDKNFEGRYVLAIFFNQGGRSNCYFHERGLTKEKINKTLMGFTK